MRENNFPISGDTYIVTTGDFEIKFDFRQYQIYKNLSIWGEEVSEFYKAAVLFEKYNIPSKAYFIMHAAREISTGLLDILGIDYERIDVKEKDGLKKKIAAALYDNERLASVWHKVAQRLHRYAHQQGSWKEPRKYDEVKNIWKDFEDFLYLFMGNFYAQTNILNKLCSKINTITKKKRIKKLVEVLQNYIRNNFLYWYFMTKCQNREKWFSPLKEKGFFSFENYLEWKEKAEDRYWPQLKFLTDLSKKAKDNEKIINEGD